MFVCVYVCLSTVSVYNNCFCVCVCVCNVEISILISYFSPEASISVCSQRLFCTTNCLYGAFFSEYKFKFKFSAFCYG